MFQCPLFICHSTDINSVHPTSLMTVKVMLPKLKLGKSNLSFSREISFRFKFPSGDDTSGD